MFPFLFQNTTILLLMIFATACASTDAPTSTWVPHPLTQSTIPSGLQVALIDKGNLYIWSGHVENPLLLAEGQLIRAYFSPVGDRIAFTRGVSALPETLWLITIDGTDEHQIDASPLISQVVWRDANTLYFNTMQRDRVGFVPRDDLFEVDVNSGDVNAITPGGNVSFSPSKKVILTSPGIFGGAATGAEAGSIRLLSADGTQVKLYTFETVATGSHRYFYPTIQWIDDAYFSTAIPASHLIYNEMDQNPPLVDWVTIKTDGTIKTMGMKASLFGLPIRSPITGDILYLKRRPETNQFTLMITSEGGANEEALQTAKAGNLLMPQWLDERFVYAYDGAYWIGKRGQDPVRWLEINPDFMTQPTIITGANAMIYQDVIGDQFQLRYIQINSHTSTLIYESENFIIFDAVLLRQ